MNILFISLGCDKNLVDSEVMLSLVNKRGYTITNDENEADIIVINTCCFIHDAKEESIETILEMGQLKKNGRLKVLIVAGCLSERYKEEFLTELSEVDGILGTTSYDKIVETIDNALAGQKVEVFESIDYLPDTSDVNRLISPGTFTAYLKIAEGCNKHCTYCIIPSLRGVYRSVPMETLVKEAKELADGGVKELVLVAQETTLYGQDIYGEKRLHVLIKELCKIEGIEWIRLLYCYPEEISQELIQTIKNEPKVCHYIDMPIQHSTDKILKRMGRRTNHEELVSMIRQLRTEIPDIAIRTTLITGFPGETREDHEALLDFVDNMEFDRLGVFTYSPEEDTPAAAYAEQVEEEVKIERRNEIMELQQAISYEQGQKMVGQTISVLVEGYLFEDDIYVGRSYKDAPKVDGCVFVTAKEEIISGEFVQVKITEAKEYDLVGEVLYEFTE